MTALLALAISATALIVAASMSRTIETLRAEQATQQNLQFRQAQLFAQMVDLTKDLSHRVEACEDRALPPSVVGRGRPGRGDVRAN